MSKIKMLSTWIRSECCEAIFCSSFSVGFLGLPKLLYDFLSVFPHHFLSMVSLSLYRLFFLYKDTTCRLLFLLMFLNAFQKQLKGDRVHYGVEFESILHHRGGEVMVSGLALAVVSRVRQVITPYLQSETRETNARTQFSVCFLPFLQSGTQSPDGGTHIQDGFSLHVKPPWKFKDRQKCIS